MTSKDLPMPSTWKTSFTLLLPLAASLFLVSCGGHSDSGVKVLSDCSQAGQNKTLYDIMKDAYLWYTEVPDLDPAAYTDIEALLEDLKYKKYDRWSYITTQSNYDNYFNSGAYIGFGFSLGFSDARAYLRVVFEGSPAYRAGLRRGMEILEINGKTISKIDRDKLWDSIYGSRTVGVEGVFKVRANGEIRQVTIKKEEVTSYSVLYDNIWDVGSERVGYFVFNKFIEPSKAELETRFARFERAGVTQLILDLRYNGGGRVHIAQYLASLIAGAQHSGKILASLKYNDHYTKWNENYKLNTEEHALGLSTLYVITTGASCSASELVINGLKPFLDVKVIGESTCGKPVGMRGYSFCDKHLAPIQFKVLNAEEKGDYYEGLAVDCPAADDLTHPFGDTDEAMLGEALYLLQHGHCSSTFRNKSTQKSEKAGTSPIQRIQGWQREIGAI